MPNIQVEAFLFDDANEEKLWEHGISLRRLYQMLDRPFSVTKNRGDRAASYVLYGTDDEGQCLAVPILPTHEDGVWYPVTAWFCKRGEWGKLPGK